MIQNFNEQPQELNKVDIIFFKIAGYFGILFTIVLIVFSYYVTIGSKIEGESNSKIIFYMVGIVFLELLIISKTSRMFTLKKKKISDYITAFFLIFFQIYFLISVLTFYALMIYLLK